MANDIGFITKTSISKPVKCNNISGQNINCKKLDSSKINIDLADLKEKKEVRKMFAGV